MTNHQDSTFRVFPLLIVLLILTGVLLILAFEGLVSYQFVSAASTIVLVAVTTYYAWHSRQSAKHTKDTLDEMQKDRKKPGAELVIAYGIDPLINVLERRKTKWHDQGEAEKESLTTVCL
jgi:flagellar basal body-associated protein FliL